MDRKLFVTAGVTLPNNPNPQWEVIVDDNVRIEYFKLPDGRREVTMIVQGYAVSRTFIEPDDHEKTITYVLKGING